MRLTHLDMWFCLISLLIVIIFEISKNVIFIFQFFKLVLQLLLTISKIESVKLKYVIIAKMNLNNIENGLQNNFQIQHWRHENTPNVGGPWTPFRVPQNFWSKRKRRVLRTTWAPPSDRQREGGVLSTLLTEEPWIFWIFDFSIFDFRFWHFDFWS